MDQAVLALEGAIAPMDCFLDDSDGRVQCSHHGEAAGTCSTKLLWTRVQMGVDPLAAAHHARGARRVRRAARRRDRHAGHLRFRTDFLRDRPRTHGRAPDQEPSRQRGREADPQGCGSARARGRVPRADGPQRLRQVDPGQRDHGSSEPRDHRGPDLLRRRGHHRVRPGRACPRRPLHGLPVPRRDPGRDRRQVPAHGHERAPRGPRRAGDLAQGLPQDRRGRDGAHEGPEGVLQPLPQRRLLRRREEAHGDPPARAHGAQARRPGRDRLGPGHRRAQHGRRRGQHGLRGHRHGRADHHPLPAHPAHHQAAVRAHHVRGPDRQGGRPGAGHRRSRSEGLRLDPRRGRRGSV